MTPGQICRDPISSKDFDKNMFNNGNNYRRRHGEKDFYTALFTRFRMKTKKITLEIITFDNNINTIVI